MTELSVDDRLAIIDLLARSAHAADETDTVALGAVFATEAVFSVEDHTANGLDAIIDALVGAAPPGQARRHLRNTVFVDGNADAPRTRSYYLITVVEDSGWPRIVTTGVYEDTLVRAAGGWRIARRVASPDGTATEAPRG